MNHFDVTKTVLNCLINDFNHYPEKNKIMKTRFLASLLFCTLIWTAKAQNNVFGK